MNVGLVSTRLAGVDGVSLETAKMAALLKQMGHQCFYCAGELDAQNSPGRLVPRMHFNDPVIKAFNAAAFRGPHLEPDVFKQIYAEADSLREELTAFVETFQIDVLVSQNSSAIPMNLPLGIAIRDLIERERIPTICHHHDFYWERERFLNNCVQDMLDSAFPPQKGPVRHLVISTIMQRCVRAWYGIEALYLPNVLDFDTPPPVLDDFALSFRETLGLADDDLIVLQPTRVVRRKGIEKAVELVRKLDDPRLILLITGYEGDEPGGYGDWLREEADRAGIRYRFIADYVDAVRGERDGHKVFSLWDIYPHAHLVTYPSTYEGFGNALIETLYFRKPVVVHTYPVYLADIKPVGVQAVEFYHDITEAVLDSTRRLINDDDWRRQMVEHNYAVGKAHFALPQLKAVLEKVLAGLPLRD